MLLDALRDFEWHNEPANVIFKEEGMLVTAEPQTDFWQNSSHNFHKDNGHFFFTKLRENFCLEVCWEAENPAAFDQCGIMVRIDADNWAKASVLSENLLEPNLGTIVTQKGNSDWAVGPIVRPGEKLTFRLRRSGRDYSLWYQTANSVFTRLRQFQLLNDDDEVKAGAYIAAPQNPQYTALLTSLKF